jgi:hypothetical protein
MTPTICGYMELSLADELGHDLARTAATRR